MTLNTQNIPIFSVDDVTNPQSEEECYNELIDVLADIDPEIAPNITNFSIGSALDSWIRVAAHVYKLGIDDTSVLFQTQFAQNSANTALDVVNSGYYSEERGEARPTRGYMRLTLSDTSLGPYTITPGDSELISYVGDTSFVFKIDDTTTLDSLNTIADVAVICETPGTIGNILYGSELSCNLPGVVVTNPPYSGSSWITQYGTDAESDSVYRNRSITKWANYSNGETVKDKLINLVLNATGSDGFRIVSHCSVDDVNPRGAGTADVYIANEVDDVSITQLSLIQSGTLDHNFFGNDSQFTEPRVKAYAATSYHLSSSDIRGLIYFNGDFATIRQQLESNLDSWVGSIPIGGHAYTSYVTRGFIYSDLESVILSTPGVTGVILYDSDAAIFTIPTSVKLLPPAGTAGKRWTKSLDNSSTQPFSWRNLVRK